MVKLSYKKGRFAPSSTSVYKNKLLRLLFLIGKTWFLRGLGKRPNPDYESQGFRVALSMGFQYGLSDTQTRKHRSSLVFVLIFKALHFANSYMLFGLWNEKMQCFIDSPIDFRRLSFCQSTSHLIIGFWTHKRALPKIQRILCWFSNDNILPIHYSFSDTQMRRAIDSLIIKGIFTASGFFNSF